MHLLLEQVCNTRKFTNSKGDIVEVHSETPLGQCEFLQSIIKDNHFKTSVEVGLAYGTSTLAIVDAIAANNGHAVAIDPAENSYWGGNGLELVKQAGYEGRLDFYEEQSHTALSRFLAEGKKFDFAYVDSTKLTDWLMVDYFLIDKLLEAGGVLVFDDVNYPSIRKLVRYIAQLPHYKVYGNWPANKQSSAIRKIIKNWLTLGANDGITVKDYKLGVYTRCVALRKIKDDERPYDWHVKF